mmetsp:Transcript_15835/g.28875  ORF Transcript_15835/g.28875 Transcript_15835/m.28875 type:complete len:242 (+) Transcript_15835:1356-2081(+)
MASSLATNLCPVVAARWPRSQWFLPWPIPAVWRQKSGEQAVIVEHVHMPPNHRQRLLVSCHVSLEHAVHHPTGGVVGVLLNSKLLLGKCCQPTIWFTAIGYTVNKLIHHASKLGVLLPAQMATCAHQEEPSNTPLYPVQLAIPAMTLGSRSLSNSSPFPKVPQEIVNRILQQVSYPTIKGTTKRPAMQGNASCWSIQRPSHRLLKKGIIALLQPLVKGSVAARIRHSPHPGVAMQLALHLT